MTNNLRQSQQFGRLLAFLGKLSDRSLSYSLTSIRPGAVMVLIAVPGEYWEVEFMVDGTVEVEVFRSDGVIGAEETLDRLFALAEEE